MTRIVSGAWSGRRLSTPRGNATRPTSEKVRAAIANALAAAGAIDGARVLDLYAGTGALGFEMASRGARRVVFVESARAAQAAIRENIAALPHADMTLFAGDASTFAASPGEPFDLVVADPPYSLSTETLGDVLAALRRGGRLAADADVVVERPAKGAEFTWPEGFAQIRRRRYGDTVICYGHAL